MSLTLDEAPVARAELLIRRPVAEVYEAFVDPALTTRFWFSRSSGRLAPGARVSWEWETYGASAAVEVKELEPERRIVIEWPAMGGTNTVEWRFLPRPDGSTFVSITCAGFSGSGDEVVAQALDATGGFTFVLAGLKAFLEHGVELNLVRDHHP